MEKESERNRKNPLKVMGTKGRHDQVVSGILSGMSGRQALTSAGYSQNTKMADVVNANDGYVRNKIIAALEKAGATDQWIAESYVKGVDIALNGEEPDINGLAQCLKQVGYLKGYGNKQQPAVAVQINNNPKSSGDIELGSTADLLGQVRDTLEVIRKEIQNRGTDTVHVRSLENGHSEAHQDLAQPSQEQSHDCGGGGA